MGWKDLLGADEEITLPWLGGRTVHNKERSWSIEGALPREYGWYRFNISGGRKAALLGESDIDPDYGAGFPVIRGYLVGDRIIHYDAKVTVDPAQILHNSGRIYLVEPGLDRFSLALGVRDLFGKIIFMSVEFPEGPEAEVIEAYQDRTDSVDHIKGVTPALDLAFRYLSWQRKREEELEAERQRLLEEEARKQRAAERARQIQRAAGTGAGRRDLARQDFRAAARAALRLSGAELLDVIATANPGEMRVQYRFRRRRLECVVAKYSLRIIDAGVCLDDHEGEKGDTYFTLESLPAVIGEAIDSDRLVVWRHV